MKTHDDINLFLGRAIALLQQGKLEEAEAIFNKILRLKPDHADANHLLGVIAIQRGQHDRAIRLIAQAIKSNPGASMFYSNYAYALNMQGRWKEGLSACERAIQLSPDFPEAHYNRGNALRALGRLDQALAAYQRVVQLAPQYADAYYCMGDIFLMLRRGPEAEVCYRRVLALVPNHAGAYNNLSVVLVNAGKFQEALAASDHAIELSPDYANAHNARASALHKLGRLEEALQACDKAIALKPDYAEAYYNRGNMLLDAGCMEAAEVDYQRALDLNPGDALLHSNILFVQAASARLPFDQMLEKLRCWDEVHGKEGRKNPMPKRMEAGKLERRLRVGYVSPHLRSHVVNFFFEPLLAAHDRNRFEIFCYASYPESRADAVTQRLRGMSDHWRFVADLSDAELARQIHQDGIDILVDLAGHTSNHRLKAFSYRPAPVQVSYLGFFGGTGLSAMDYWVTDEVIHPQDTPEQAVEQIYRLPRCWVCYQPSEQAPEVAPCPSVDDRVVFGSFSHLPKLTAGVIETWSKLLLHLPQSRLLLMARALGDQKVVSMLLEKFACHGIAPERLLLRKGAPYREYYATYAEVDIVLDPFPRTGGTTTAEALWMGVPVVTLAGDRYVERISASKLTAVGLPELIAGSREEYIDKALSLARDPVRRTELRADLRNRMAQSPLCDGHDLARAMESAYQSMWAEYLSGT